MSSHKKIMLVGIIVLAVFSAVYFFLHGKFVSQNKSVFKITPVSLTPPTASNQLQIAEMRKRTYPGSDLVIEQTLAPGSNYNQYIASYKSDGLKIYGLLTIPQGVKPKNGWPVIIFNHGFIPPATYRTTERYVAYVDAFARDGYIVFKSDYRGNGSSEGKPEGAYYSPAYTADVLNALSSLKKYKDVDVDHIGMWGHSMGGNITLRVLVVDPKDIKAAVSWGGVVGSYEDLLYNWHRRVSYQPPPSELALRNNYRETFLKQYGKPQENPVFWHSIDPTYFLSSISAPIQLDHGELDDEVPLDFSLSLKEKLEDLGKIVELYTYSGADHNISQSFSLAMSRSVDFFDKYLK